MSALDIIKEIAIRQVENKERSQKRDQYRNTRDYYDSLMKDEDCSVSDNLNSINTFIDMLALQMGQVPEKTIDKDIKKE